MYVMYTTTGSISSSGYEHSESSSDRAPETSGHYHLRSVLPLATPKDQKVRSCKLCPISARFICMKCKVACYCSFEHLETDRIHEQICGDLKFLGEPQLFMPTAEGRDIQKRNFRCMKQKLAEKLKLIAFTREMSDDDTFQAKLACKYGVDLLLHELGDRHLETVELLLLLVSYCIKLKHFDEAENYLEMMSMGLSEDSYLPFHFRADLYKTRGNLETARGNDEEALKFHADEVYWMAHAHGTHHELTATSYWRLGSAFARMGQSLVAASMYRQCIEIWVGHLDSKYQEQYESEKNRASLEFSPEQVELDMRLKLDGREVLQAIYQARLHKEVPTSLRDKVMAVFALAMYEYLTGRYLQAYKTLHQISKDCEELEDKDLVASVTVFYKVCRKKVPESQEKKYSRDNSWGGIFALKDYGNVIKD